MLPEDFWEEEWRWRNLFQIGSIGLLKAIDKFDETYMVKFSTYAVPMIAGEIKRFLRDDGILKVSRSLKENYYHVYQCKEQLEVLYGREPTVTELAGILKLPVEELVMTLDAAQEVVSLHRTVYQGDGNDISLMDRIPDKENPQEKMLNRILLEQNPGRTGGKRENTHLYALLSGTYPVSDCGQTWNFPGTGFQNGKKDIEQAS